MTVNIHPLSKESFEKKLKTLLGVLEGLRPLPYADTARVAHPTVGIGFDLTVPTVRDAVFESMGISGQKATDIAAVITSVIGKTTEEIRSALNKVYGQTFEMTEAQIDAVFNKISATYVDQAMARTGQGGQATIIWQGAAGTTPTCSTWGTGPTSLPRRAVWVSTSCNWASVLRRRRRR